MRVTSVELRSGDLTPVVLSFRDPRRVNQYNVKAITGLDADEIQARPYGGSASGATRFRDLKQQKREIVARIELNPRFGMDESYSDLRDNLYRFISASRTGKFTFRFLDGEAVVAAISGWVKKFEAAHFTKTPEVQITLDCEEPFLKALNRVSIDSGLNVVNPTVVDDLSTAHHGFRFEIGVETPTAFFEIADPDDASWNFRVTPEDGFEANDIIHFSSEYNNKYLYIERPLEDNIHIADKLELEAVWPIMFPGENVFHLTDRTNFTWVTLQYFPTYWGV